MTYDPREPVFLRIGDWHPSGRSRNYATGETEAGVSVYDLVSDGGILVPPDGEWALDDLMSRLRSGEPRHLVQGMVVGTGGDGEPTLASPRIVGEWPSDLPAGFRASAETGKFDTVGSVDDALPFDTRPIGSG